MSHQRFLHITLCTIETFVLPLDTLIKPRRIYAEEDNHKIALQEQHKAFMLVHRSMKEAKKKQKKSKE